MDLKKNLNSELEKLKHMSVKDKIWYILEYYKFHMIAIILFISMLWVIGISIYRQSFTTRLTLAIVNDYSGGNSSIEPLENSLKDALGCGKKDLIEINSGLFINTDEPQASQYAYASMAKIAALSAGGNLDIIIADPLIKQLIPKEKLNNIKFISFPHVAVSSKIYWDNIPLFIGDNMNKYLLD